MRCSVVFGVRLRLLFINISSSSPAINTAAYYQWCVITCDFGLLHLHSQRGRAMFRVFRRFPSEYRHPVCYGKTRIVWWKMFSKKVMKLVEVDRSQRLCSSAYGALQICLWYDMIWYKISLFVLTECTNVTDTGTDRHTGGHRMVA